MKSFFWVLIGLPDLILFAIYLLYEELEKWVCKKYTKYMKKAKEVKEAKRLNKLQKVKK